MVIPALPQFLARHPKLEIILSVDDRRIDLIEEGVDCSIRVGALSDNRLVARSLGVIELINSASRGDLGAHPVLHTLDDPSRH